MKSQKLSIKVFNWVPLLTLSFFLTAFIVVEPPNESLILQESRESLRIAVLPFQDESLTPSKDGLQTVQFFNHIMGAVKQLNACPQPLDWVSKSQLANSFQILGENGRASNISASLLDSLCQQLETDILIQGEFLVDEQGQVEVFYSYENCKGFYSSQIKYQSPQPIVGRLNEIDQLYAQVGQAIKKDMEVYLDCKALVDIEGLFQPGYEQYLQADSLPSHYLRAIDQFEKVLEQDPNHKDAIYYAGLSYFSLGEHKKASGYFAQIPEYKDIPKYQIYSKIGSRPAFWYNTHRKRKIWWEKELSPDWQETINVAVLKKSKDHQPTLEELEELFKKTSVRIVNYPLENLEGLAALTNITQLSCNKNKLTNLQGVEKLQNLGQINLDNNKLNHLDGIDKLPLLTRLYVRNNPIKSLSGIENVDKSRFVLFCSYNVPREEIKRVKNLGINVQQ